MYNRYIPQPDGSFKRNRVQEPHPPKAHPKQPPKPCPPPPPLPEPAQECPLPPPPPPPPPCHTKSPPCKRVQSKEPGGIGNFFKQLLPKDLDTADLLIIILLLLMAGDKEEDQTNALLTLALYFFM